MDFETTNLSDPFSTSDAVELLEPEARPEVDSSETPRTILAIDDDDAHTELLAYRLGQHGYRTIIAHCGKEGIEKARTLAPALIVLDLRLPDGHGLDICRQLVDDPATCTIPVVILSGMEGPDILRDCRSAGCCYFLRKPYDPSALLLLVRQAIQDAESWNAA